ncbi:hypothetical protein CYMTET_35894 [Cymbomonas tetramitiformis]|uniref:Uncharacterized protein n=1 Tax=Cymbomonas tetramitiformis TaxID=36881 RepID=A0AAE0F8A7_9CHLO|nr:hypothetical protein CYMTET_35894 [Cymbomonas tetramitiformis]
MAAPARLRVLARLAETHSKQLCNRDILRALHQECQAAGLAVPFVGGGNDLERLQSIFTVALENNLASVIIQFVDEVVRDEMAVSSDIIEANMLDGDQVLFWVQTTYDSLLTKCARAHRQVLDDASVKLGGLTMVLEALRDPLESDDQKRVHVQGFEEGFEASRQRADELARVEALLRAVRVLQQFAELMAWVRGCEVHPRWSSTAEWKRSVQLRRDRAPPCGIFIDALHRELGEHAAYARDEIMDIRQLLVSLTERLFLLQLESSAASERSATKDARGDPEEAALMTKKRLLLYYLLDMGCPLEGPPTECAWCLGVPLPVLRDVYLCFLLDDERATDPADRCGLSSLDIACQILPSVADATTDFKVVEVLLHRGRYDVALSVLRARHTEDPQLDPPPSWFWAHVVPALCVGSPLAGSGAPAIVPSPTVGSTTSWFWSSRDCSISYRDGWECTPPAIMCAIPRSDSWETLLDRD